MLVLFGGSFNPPTIAHKSIIEVLSKKYEQVILVPNGEIYQRKNLVSFFHRKKMLELLINDLDNVIISDIEQSRQFRGTFETLRDLNHPVFACGDDCLKDLHTWLNAKTLLEENSFVIFTRTMTKEAILDFITNDEFLSKYKNKFDILEINYPCISSTDYKEKKDHSNLTKEVLNYVEENLLYKED